jgi:5-methylcytosine-specific restriction endonuclease McrA
MGGHKEVRMDTFDDQPWLSLWDSSDQAPDPRAARREAWALYLASREWVVLRRSVFQRAHGTCERCYVQPATQVHHVTYIRRFKELADDLRAICEGCHRYLSGKIDADPRPLTRLDRLLDDLNNAA